MGSKWVEVRDSLVEALKIEEVGKDLKNNFVTWLESEGVEFAQKFVDKIIEECKADAPQETGWCRIRKDAPEEKGWCKVRDAFVLPLAIQGGLTVLKVIIEKAAAEAKN